MGTVSKKAVWGAAIALCLLLPARGAAAGPQSRKLDKVLQDSQSSGESRMVIVRTRAGKKAAVAGKVARRTSHYEQHGLIDAVSARLTGAEIAALANDPDVESVSIDADVTTSATTSYASSDVVSDLKQSLSLGNWFTGSNVTVAVIDSGLAWSTDFDGRILGMYDFTNARNGAFVLPSDGYGHGTHVAGLIGSSGASSSNRYGGVAPGVKLLALKVLDKRGAGKTSDVIRALEFAVANRTRFNIRIVNLSLGHPIYESAKTDPLVAAVEAAVRSGLIVVVAAGNYGTNPVTGQTGYAGIASPGNAPSAITVGAAMTNNTVRRTDDRLAPYSSRGPSWYDGIAKPDVLAPGQGLVSNDAAGSTLETDYPSLVVKPATTRYLKLSGSSMATGVVSGLVAALIEANEYGAYQRWQTAQDLLRRPQRTSYTPPPALTSNAIKAMLEYSATPLRDAAGQVYGPLEQGSGLVNGLGAIELAYFADTTKPAGHYWMTYDVPASTTFGGIDEPWSQRVTWGTRFLRGSSVVEVNQPAWASYIVWGTGELDKVVTGAAFRDVEDNIVWGTAMVEDNIVWGTSVPLSTSIVWAGNAGVEDNIVWGTSVVWDDNIVWGTSLVGVVQGSNIVWGSFRGVEDNIVWGTLTEDNIVWGTSANRVLGLTFGGGR